MAKTFNVPGIGAVKAPYLYAGIGITVGILALAWWRASSAPPADEGQEAAAGPGEYITDPAGDPYAQGSDAYGYNTVYPPYYPPRDDDEDDDPPRSDYTSNAAWSDAAVGVIVQSGATETAAYTAVSGVLAGLPVTSEQEQMFLRAAGILGEPPDGYPKPIRKTNTPQNPKPNPDPHTPPGPPKLTVPKGLKVIDRTTTSVRLDWAPVKGATGYAIYRGGTRINTAGLSVYRVRGLKRGTAYRLSVRPVARHRGNEVLGPAASITVTTKGK